MEKYAGILRTINDKIESQDEIIWMYREKTTKQDDRIRELEDEIKALKREIDNLTK